MNAVGAMRAGLDPALLAARAAELPAPLRAGTAVPQQQAGAAAGVSQGAALLASLYTRLDEAYAVAKSERAASGGDPARGDAERLRKLFPPYPQEYERRAAYLEGLVGLSKQNQALSLPAERMAETTYETERRMQALSQAAAGALAAQPSFGLSRDPARVAEPLTQTIEEGRA